MDLFVLRLTVERIYNRLFDRQALLPSKDRDDFYNCLEITEEQYMSYPYQEKMIRADFEILFKMLDKADFNSHV